MVELGLMLPLLLVICIGVIEVVTAFNHYITVVNAARDGARIGSKGSVTDDEIRSLIVNDLSRLPRSSDITPTNAVAVDRSPVPGDTAIKVEACYDHHLMLHITLVMPDTVRICSSTTMRMLPTPVPAP
jgi:Flp pilus assembly protein TadG